MSAVLCLLFACLAFVSTFAINRKDFGINYAGAADNLIRGEVVLTLHIRGVSPNQRQDCTTKETVGL